MCDERVPHGLDGPLRRDGLLNVPRREQRDTAQSPFTPVISLVTESFASPNSITVFGST